MLPLLRARDHASGSSLIFFARRFSDVGVADSLNADGHDASAASGHSAHFGRSGVHVSWPKPTNSGLISIHSSRGSQLSSDARVSSGVFLRGDPFLPIGALGRPPEALGDSMHVHVDANSRRLLPSDVHDQVRHLRSDARQRAQRLDARGNVPVVLVQ